MKKYILSVILVLCLLPAFAQDTTTVTPPTAPKEEKAKTNTALWISLGVVFFVLFIAMNAKKIKKHRE